MTAVNFVQISSPNATVKNGNALCDPPYCGKTASAPGGWFHIKSDLGF